MSQSLYVVATESSGDLLGSELFRAMKSRAPLPKLRGVGGDLMCAQGLQASYHVRDFNVMGLAEVLSQLRRLKRQFNHMLEDIRADPPSVIVLIDAPDFNIRLAQAVRDLGIPVIYYVSPQVWAWRGKRAGELAGLVDHILLLFPFEAEIYRKFDVQTTVVGHPLVDRLAERLSLKRGRDDSEKPLIMLAPGSRTREVEGLLPTMLAFAEVEKDAYQFGLAVAPSVDSKLYDRFLHDCSLKLIVEPMRDLLMRADAAVVASGTATLETGLMGVPMVVAYRLHPMTYSLAKRLVRSDHIALVNIVLGERVVPELVQRKFRPATIADEINSLVYDRSRREYVLKRLHCLPNELGGPGASQRAARVVHEALSC